MIYDRIRNLSKHNFDNNKGLQSATKLLSSLNLNQLDVGYKAVYENYTISVTRYTSKPMEQAKYEMHKKPLTFTWY